MESRNAKIVRLMGIITTNGSQCNDLKLEQLFRIAGQPDISIEIDQDDGDALSQPDPNENMVSDSSLTRRKKRTSDVSVNKEQPAKRRGHTNVVSRRSASC